MTPTPALSTTPAASDRAGSTSCACSAARLSAVSFAGKADEHGRFKNKRAEMYFAVCDWIRAGGALPESEELVEELSATTYTFAKGSSQLILEDKDQIKAKLDRSPDLADALALTFAQPVTPRDYRPSLQTAGGGVESRTAKRTQNAVHPSLTITIPLKSAGSRRLPLTGPRAGTSGTYETGVVAARGACPNSCRL